MRCALDLEDFVFVRCPYRRICMSKVIISITSALVLGVAAASLAQSNKKTITITSWAGNDKLIEGVLPGFLKENPDLEVKIVGGSAYSDYHPGLNNRLNAGKAEDVVSLGGQFVVDYAEGTLLADLKSAPFNFGASARTKFVASQIAAGIGAKGNVVAVPNDAPPQVTYYRRDVLEKAGLKIQNLTSSWESYLEAGKKLKSMGYFISNGAGDIATVIIGGSVPRGEGLYFDKSGKSTVDSERFVKAFTIAKQVRDAGLDSRIPGWTPEWFGAFKTGKVVTVSMGSWFENILTDNVGKDGEGKWGVALSPEKNTSIAGGAFFSIPAASKNKAEAWKLVQYLTSPKVQAEVFKQSGNFPANLDTLKEPVFNEASAYFGGQKIRQVYAQAAKRTAPLLPSKNFAMAEGVVNDALRQVLEQNKDIKTVLAEAKVLIERRTSR
jgi:multiple sugar transport system substrate-binding protein